MSDARRVVAVALGYAADQFPNLAPTTLDVSALGAADRQLALAIHRTALQRWMTLEFLLNQHLKQPMHRLEPKLRGVLLSAAAQLMMFDRLPRHAVVDESVKLARRLVRAGAAGLVNAVLRRLAEQSTCPLPDPHDRAHYLSVVTSHRKALVSRWIDQFGELQTTQLCRHGVQTPPVWVALEDGRFKSWEGSHADLVAFLREDPHRRVQDPAAAMPVSATADLRPGVIVDFCAGKGTKARQAATLHADAQVLTHDVDAAAVATLQTDLADLSNVRPLDGNSPIADLLILDVPCTNTGALARRPEAKYRFSARSLESLVKLQRRIVQQALPLVRSGGQVLYCTCSLEPGENRGQVDWLIRQTGASLVSEQLTLPRSAPDYHDGSYFALLRLA